MTTPYKAAERYARDCVAFGQSVDAHTVDHLLAELDALRASDPCELPDLWDGPDDDLGREEHDGTGDIAEAASAVVEAYAALTGVPADRILGRKKNRDLSSARRVCWLVLEEADFTLAAIGEQFSGRSESTVGQALSNTTTAERQMVNTVERALAGAVEAA